MQADLKRKKTQLINVRKQKNRIVGAIGHGTITETEASHEMESLREKEQLIPGDIYNISNQLDKLPDPDDKLTGNWIQIWQQLINSHYRDPSRILDMSFDEKREFLKQFFHDRKAGLGIFVKVNEDENDKEHPFKFSMKGRFGDVRPEFYDHLPLDDSELIYMMCGTDKVSKKDRDKILSELNLNSIY